MADQLQKFIADVDEAELMCQLIEAASNGKFKRPDGITAVQAISCLQEEDQNKWRRVARVVVKYFNECLKKPQRVQ
jgi:hypothetical protein